MVAQVLSRNSEADGERTPFFYGPVEGVPAKATKTWEAGGSLVLKPISSATSYGLASA